MSYVKKPVFQAVTASKRELKYIWRKQVQPRKATYLPPTIPRLLRSQKISGTLLCPLGSSRPLPRELIRAKKKKDRSRENTREKIIRAFVPNHCYKTQGCKVANIYHHRDDNFMTDRFNWNCGKTPWFQDYFPMHQMIHTCKSFSFSFDLIQVLPWVCGSMRSGYLVAFVTMMPFWMERSSPGNPCSPHSPIWITGNGCGHSKEHRKAFVSD